MKKNTTGVNILISIVVLDLLLAAIFLGILGLQVGSVSDFYANLATEFFSIAITVIVIDQIYRWRDRLHNQELDKQEIIEQMGSPANGAALEAVRLARRNGFLTDGSFKGAQLVDAHLKGARLWRANLEDAKLTSANLENAALWDAKLEGAVLFDAHLEGANLKFTSLERANLGKAHLKGANLKFANLERANLWGAHLERANLQDANLEGVYLWGAHLEGANLMDANLKGAECNNETTWPDGFDFRARGVINVGDEK